MRSGILLLILLVAVHVSGQTPQGYSRPGRMIDVVIDVGGRKLWKKFDPAQASPAQNLPWRKEFLRDFAETDAGIDRPRGGLPVIVSAGNPAATEADWRAHDGAGGQSGFSEFLSSNEVHITAAGSGHEIHLYRPNTVVQAPEHGISVVRTAHK
jgi:hypothetical protein